MILIDRYIETLEKFKLTQAQLLLLYVIKHKRNDILRRYKALFPTDDGSAIGMHSINDLINRGFIDRVSTDKVGISAFKIGAKFNEIFADKFSVAEEFWNLYPSSVITPDGKRLTVKAMDEDEFRETYYKKILGNKDEHDEVIKDLQYALDNRLINISISNFVKSRQWIEIRKERLTNNTTSDEKKPARTKGF